jgi:acyl-CoA thioesterase FadM
MWVTRVGRTSLGLRHEIVRIEADATETLVATGSEDRVFVAHGRGGLQPRELTSPMRAALARYADPLLDDVTRAVQEKLDGLQRS